MAGKKNNKNKRPSKAQRRSNRQYKQATTNVQLQNQPSIDLLNAQMQQAQQDFQRSTGRWNSIGGGYQDELAALPQTDYGAMADDFTQRLSDISSMFGGQAGMNASEVAAGQGMGSTLGQGALANLSQFGAREGAAREAAGREGALYQRYGQENLMKGFEDTLQGYNNSLAQINSRVPSQIQQEQDRLRQQHIENQLAKSKMASDDAFSQYLQDQLGNMAGGGGGGFGGGGGGGGGGGNGGQGGGGGGSINQFPHDDNNFTPPSGGQGGGQGIIPNAWQNADTWNELPPVVTHSYTRPYGVSLRSMFNQSPHPSFDNFQEFRRAYEEFRRRINQLYNARGGPGYEGGGPR